MKNRKTWTTFTVTLLLLAICGLPAQQNQPPGANDNDVAVVVNPLNPVDSISSSDLSRLFMGEKLNWNGSLPVFIVVRAPMARERNVLLRTVVKMTDADFKQYWVKKVYSGEVQREPLALMSNGMQLEAVRTEKGAIALINMSDLRPGVKVLKVDGHLPGSSGYALR